MHHPTAADYRDLARRRERRHDALAGLSVMALAALVFLGLPWPAA
jgi:hypothetical protein